MGADEPGLSPSQRIRLEQVAARLVLGEGFRAEDAVRLAADLVAEGIDVDGLVQLASQPADLRMLDSREVEVLFRTALAEVDLELPSREAAGWVLVRWVAARMIEGAVAPAEGAWQLWSLWEECGQAGELAEMLQLHDDWQSSIGADGLAIEAKMLAYATEVITAADRSLAGNG